MQAQQSSRVSPVGKAVRNRNRVVFVGPPEENLDGHRHFFEQEGYEVSVYHEPEKACVHLESEVTDVCFVDTAVSREATTELVPRLRKLSPWTTFLLIAPEEHCRAADDCVQKGASDYVVRPCTPMQLHLSALRHVRMRRMESRLECLESELGISASNDLGLRSDSPAMMQILDLAAQVAETDANLLICGESGTGKGVLARAVHNCSPRSDEEFVTINCPSLSADLLESELFGHRKGAFTGAVSSNPGRVIQADGGTLFLDEIGDFPMPLQPKLLRFVQDREFERIGDPQTRSADLRLIAATNRDLEAMVGGGEFREDLFYRLNVVTLRMPGLRERPEDIPALAQGFLEKFSRSYRKYWKGFEDRALDALTSYDWPGNIRELHNVIERAVILGDGELIGADALGVGQSGAGAGEDIFRPGDDVTLAALEQAHIAAVLGKSDSLERAATVLGINPSTLWRKRKQYDL